MVVRVTDLQSCGQVTTLETALKLQGPVHGIALFIEGFHTLQVDQTFLRSLRLCTWSHGRSPTTSSVLEDPPHI